MPDITKFNKPYNPKEVEDKIYKLWEKSGFFDPDNLPVAKLKNLKTNKLKNYCIIMPPPNANGLLHMGHALFVALEDLMIRYHRMKGEKTLWLPGADHAGFETQVVFDKKLEKEGRNRFPAVGGEISREELYKEIWDFTQENKIQMENQLRKLGASCDWSREKFTLDPDIIEIVYDTFRKLYKDGLAYRDLRVINWCTKHQTALSDLEVKYVEREDKLYFIKYGPLTLATVRPETKFGDTALAVNPKDKRYQKYIGKEIEAKGLLGKLKFKVIADEAVDPSFGTGVVKVTPAHDPADFEIWQRHKQEIPGPKIIIDERGRLTGDVGEFKGLKISEAREKVAEKMKEIGILEKIEPYKHQVATCYKCGTTLEPLPRMQWFIRMTEAPRKYQASGVKHQEKFKSLRDLAVDAVKSGKIKFVTKKYEKIFLHWMKNLRDWNISRQITWGIRIPAWYCIPQHSLPLMGYYYEIVPQVLLKGKSRTYRLRDHGLEVGDLVAFENSQTKTIFGHGVIEKIDKKKIRDIKLPDPIHGGGYKTLDELLVAFRRHYPPDRVITGDTETLIYDFRFIPFDKENPSGGCGHIIMDTKKPTRCPNCGGDNLIQDPDVFDTWFSSGQWPFATLMTAAKNDFKEFYPTDVMETGWDILFFWVARMIMLGIYATGKVPFKTIYLHGLVRDKDRQKMSKSKGNVIDPLGVAEMYGADAVRMALVTSGAAGTDPVISEEKIRGYRNFSTKIWNIAKFILMNYEPKSQTTKAKLTAKDKKHLAALKKIRQKVSKEMDSYKFHEAALTIYHYIWHTFADKVIEESKPRLKSEDIVERAAAFQTNLQILIASLKMLHPFMPFVTEEIYQNLPIRRSSRQAQKLLMVESW